MAQARDFDRRADHLVGGARPTGADDTFRGPLDAAELTAQILAAAVWAATIAGAIAPGNALAWLGLWAASITIAAFSQWLARRGADTDARRHATLPGGLMLISAFALGLPWAAVSVPLGNGLPIAHAVAICLSLALAARRPMTGIEDSACSVVAAIIGLLPVSVGAIAATTLPLSTTGAVGVAFLAWLAWRALAANQSDAGRPRLRVALQGRQLPQAPVGFARAAPANTPAAPAAGSAPSGAPKDVMPSTARDAEVTVLREELERRTAALATAQRALTEKSRFLAAASHDLRQPIHAIGLFAGALKEEVRDGRGRYLIDRLERSMSGLDELFNRLLDIARLDAGMIEPQSSAFAIGPMLQTLESRFQTVAQARSLQLRVHMPRAANVRCDPTLLSELLMNLLSNALRYTERGSVLLGARRRGDRLSIEVWDTGPGIAAKDREAIFEEFVQIGNTSHDRRQGLGLGLSIVRRLAAALECPVTMSSRPGRGSVFRVSVPLTDDLPERVDTLHTEGGDERLAGLLVLVVDDEIDILVGMQALLSSWGCYVLMARSLAEVRARLDASERFPDVLITDHRLGGAVTSAQVAGLVYESVPQPMPVIVVSGEATSSLSRVAQERGWRLLNKPVNAIRLKSLLVELTAPAG